ncbi:ABC transporter substrate-binding protein [Cupriavidus sp. H19C3]|uniref:Bug family tripartite tricarboxylate transporter substrate binding protein n=1 Tax=Cupriavidus sp. H19C3 TaxID=3241603 RepID=UPI003BF8B6B2
MLGRSTNRWGRACLLAAACVAAAPALADTFPDKPIKLVVPFPPGGSTDVLGRLLARKLSETLNASVVVENRAGAGTIVGADYVAKSTPDGYTLLLSAATTFTINPVTYAKLPYDPLKSFDAIGLVGTTTLGLVANTSVKANTLKELVAASRQGQAFAFGSYGAGTTAHFVGEMINAATGMHMMHVPYKGSAPAMSDLIGNQIPLTVDTVVAAAPMVKAGKVKVLALASSTRSALLPDVPTAAESGYPDINLTTWFAVVGPKGLAAPVRQKLEGALATVMKDADMRKSMTTNGYEAEYGTAADYVKRVNSEIPRLRKIAEAANIKAD